LAQSAWPVGCVGSGSSRVKRPSSTMAMLPQRAMHRPQKPGIAAAAVALMVCSSAPARTRPRLFAMQRPCNAIKSIFVSKCTRPFVRRPSRRGRARYSRPRRPVRNRHRRGSFGSGLASAVACRAAEGGATFTPPDIREVPAAAVEARGSEKCDVAYHVDGQRYQLGGCNREYLGEW
jgi:hypothetical protein